MPVAAAQLPAIDLTQVPESVRPAIQALVALATQLVAENQLLRGKLDAFIRRYFGGQKNESLSSGQLELLLQGFTQELVAAQTSTATKAPAAESRRAPVRQRLPENLPVRSRQELIPAEVQAEPDAFRKIDETVTDILDYEPGRLVRDQVVRPRFVRRDAADATVLAAPLPNRLIEKGLPGPGLLAHVLIERFQNHQPFYRQQQCFAQRHQYSLSRQTLVGWMEPLADWLQAIVNRMRSGLVGGDYLQVDETVIRYLDRDEPGKSQTGYLWAYSHPRGDVVFDWRISRSREGPAEFLAGFKGVLQTDGYSAYISLAEERPELDLCHCVAHWRRKFIEAKDEDRRAHWFLLQFRHLYAVEARARHTSAGPALRQAWRSAESRMIWARLKRAVDVLTPKVLPQSLLGRALAYGRNQWTGLVRHLELGRVEIDNNLVENAIRPTAVGKKNFLFVGHPDAGWRSAVFYSLVESCRRRGINAERYLKDVLVHLPDLQQSELDRFLPGEWIKRHPEARLQKTP